AAMARELVERLARVVVVRERDGNRRVEGAAAADERQERAVIAAPEGQHAGPAGEGAGGAQRHHVGLGAAVGEAHALERREAGAQEGCQLPLPLAYGRQVEAAVDGG